MIDREIETKRRRKRDRNGKKEGYTEKERDKYR